MLIEIERINYNNMSKTLMIMIYNQVRYLIRKIHKIQKLRYEFLNIIFRLFIDLSKLMQFYIFKKDYLLAINKYIQVK